MCVRERESACVRACMYIRIMMGGMRVCVCVCVCERECVSVCKYIRIMSGGRTLCSSILDW